jgi:hypothetical protein
MPSYRTGFTVSHGFKFANTFTFDVRLTPGLRLGQVEPGLCGGMAYAALDYYHAGIPIPTRAEPPPQGSPLSRYLVARQVASNGVGLLLNVTRWTLRDETALQARMLAQELPTLRSRLQRNQPTVLVLIRAWELAHITDNHQVVAYGYDEDPATGSLVILVYDPNRPGEPIRLSLELAQPEWGLEPWHSWDDGFKGFILQSYASRRQGLPLGA